MLELVRPTALARRNGNPAARPTRWDPWTEMARTRQEMDDLVTRVFGFTPLSQMVGGAAPGTPPAEFYETAEQFVLRLHLPGMAREDINLEVNAERVALWGERRAQLPVEEAKVHFNTVGTGSFRFETALPVKIKPEEVRAGYRDGVLEVTLPKAEADKPNAIKVAIEG